MSDNKRKKLTKKVNKLARRFAKINYAKPAHTKLITKIKFALCRIIQNKVRKSGTESYDLNYWRDNGWLGKNRPWKKPKS